MFEEYFMNNVFISDVQKLEDNIYQLRRNIKEYIDAMKENMVLDCFNSVIDKLEVFNEELIKFTQYAYYSEYKNPNKLSDGVQRFYEDVCHIKGYLEGIIEWIKIAPLPENVVLQKYYVYIAKDLKKLSNVVEDLNFAVAGYNRFLNKLC